MKSVKKRILIGIAFISMIASSCGYHMRGAERPFFKLHEIQTLYVYPVKNNSYKAGVEITFYNALRKKFSQGGYVRLVDKPEQADGFIAATVQDAAYYPLAVTTADKIANAGTIQAPGSIQIASSYQVNMQVQVLLTDKNNKSLWSDVVSRNKSFAASNYMGALGSTSALINEGEFERTLNDLSVGIATDTEESINTIF
jgi:hypothetical protein